MRKCGLVCFLDCCKEMCKCQWSSSDRKLVRKVLRSTKDVGSVILDLVEKDEYFLPDGWRVWRRYDGKRWSTTLEFYSPYEDYWFIAGSDLTASEYLYYEIVSGDFFRFVLARLIGKHS